MAIYHLTAPFSAEDMEQLQIGDVVYVTGRAFTCRSRLHRWVFDEGKAFPLTPGDRDVLIHVGPIVVDQNGRWHLVSFMPTSSIRFEKWGARSVADWRLRMIIGKTTMGQETIDAMRRLKCVHVCPQSVSPCAWVDSIEIEGVDLFDALGSIEATWHLQLRDLGPFVVDIDTRGNDLYQLREQEVDRNLAATLSSLGIGPEFTYTKLY